jgi:hypothetical protein
MAKAPKDEDPGGLTGCPALAVALSPSEGGFLDNRSVKALSMMHSEVSIVVADSRL